MTSDEVRMLDNKYAILFIRGERPVKDLKFNLFEHKNAQLSGLGKSKPYIHGGTENAIATISFSYDEIDDIQSTNEITTDYEILSEEEIEKWLNEREEK